MSQGHQEFRILIAVSVVSLLCEGSSVWHPHAPPARAQRRPQAFGCVVCLWTWRPNGPRKQEARACIDLVPRWSFASDECRRSNRLWPRGEPSRQWTTEWGSWSSEAESERVFAQPCSDQACLGLAGLCPVRGPRQSLFLWANLRPPRSAGKSCQLPAKTSGRSVL